MLQIDADEMIQIVQSQGNIPVQQYVKLPGFHAESDESSIMGHENPKISSNNLSRTRAATPHYPISSGHSKTTRTESSSKTQSTSLVTHTLPRLPLHFSFSLSLTGQRARMIPTGGGDTAHLARSASARARREHCAEEFKDSRTLSRTAKGDIGVQCSAARVNLRVQKKKKKKEERLAAEAHKGGPAQDRYT